MESQDQAQPNIFILSDEQAAELDRLGPGPEAAALAEQFGAIAVEGNVALVVRQDPESGEEVPDRLMTLGNDDIGTTLNPRLSRTVMDRPELQDLSTLHAQLRANQDSEVVAETNDSEAPSIEQVLSELGVSELVSRFGTITHAFEDSINTDRLTTANALDQLQQARARVMSAASMLDGSARLIEQRPLLNIIEDTVNAVKAARNQRGHAERDALKATLHSSEDFDNVAAGVTSRLQGSTEPRAVVVGQQAREVADALRASAQLLHGVSTDADEKFNLSLHLINGIVDDPYITLDEANQRILRAIGTVEEIAQTNGRKVTSFSELKSHLDALKSSLQ